MNCESRRDQLGIEPLVSKKRKLGLILITQITESHKTTYYRSGI